MKIGDLNNSITRQPDQHGNTYLNEMKEMFRCRAKRMISDDDVQQGDDEEKNDLHLEDLHLSLFFSAENKSRPRLVEDSVCETVRVENDDCYLFWSRSTVWCQSEDTRRGEEKEPEDNSSGSWLVYISLSYVYFSLLSLSLSVPVVFSLSLSY